MTSKSLLVYALVGIFLSGVINFGYMEFQKMQINGDLFKGDDDICKWDGVNCVSFKILVSNTTEEAQQAKMKLLFSSNPSDESSATGTTDDDALVVARDATEMVHKSSLEKEKFEINDWATYPQVVHPRGVMGSSLLDEMIGITIKVLHYFIARCNQFRYQAPWLQRSSIMSLPFWLAFVPSITLM